LIFSLLCASQYILYSFFIKNSNEIETQYLPASNSNNLFIFREKLSY